MLPSSGSDTDTDIHIRTTTIYPAAINTELLPTIREKGTRDQLQGVYDKYAISPERIASVLAFPID